MKARGKWRTKHATTRGMLHTETSIFPAWISQISLHMNPYTAYVSTPNTRPSPSKYPKYFVSDSLAGAISAHLSEIYIDGRTKFMNNTAQRHGGEAL